MNLARALRELEIVELLDRLAAMRPLKQIPLPPGRWSTVPPAKSGQFVYRHVGDARYMVSFFYDPPHDDRGLEWFYAEGDVDGSPTQNDKLVRP